MGGTHWTRNQTLRRGCDVDRGHDAFVAEQWQPAGVGNFSGLGEHERIADVRPREAEHRTREVQAIEAGEAKRADPVLPSRSMCGSPQ